MKNIQLKGRTIEPAYGRNVDTMPVLLARCEKGEGIILSEADVRKYGIENSEIRDKYWDTSTLSATKGETVKVILPYETGSKTLTDVARFGLGLINPDEDLINYEVDLDVDGRWEKLEGSGVYTLQRKRLILNKDLTEAEAMKHKLLLTKLGHPNHVDGKFARSKDEVAEIIGKTFELGKSEYGYDIMMGQYLPSVDKKGALKVWFVGRLGDWVKSSAEGKPDYSNGKFAFNSTGDANTKIIRPTLEQTLTIGSILEETGHTSDFAPNQIKKLQNILEEKGYQIQRK